MVGIFFTVRKLDAQSRRHEEFAHVAPAAFADWQTRETRLYAWGAWGSFAKVVLDYAFVQFLAPKLPFAAVRAIGATIDLGWLALVIVTLVLASASRRRRQRLGIVLGGFVVQEPPEDGPGEPPHS